VRRSHSSLLNLSRENVEKSYGERARHKGILGLQTLKVVYGVLAFDFFDNIELFFIVH